MEYGHVAFWNEERSYGFIARDDGGLDVFVHRSALKGVERLIVGQPVEFEIGPGRQGPEAVRVHVNVDADT